MEAYGYLFLTSVALAVVVTIVTFSSWIKNRTRTHGNGSYVLLALNFILGGLVVFLTVLMFAYFPPADRQDAVFTLAPFLVTVVLVAISLKLSKKKARRS